MAKMTIEGTPKQIEIGIAALCHRCSRLTVEGVAEMLRNCEHVPVMVEEQIFSIARAVIAYVKGKEG